MVTEPTRAQENTLEALALRHDQVRCTPLALGAIRADCLDRRPAGVGVNIVAAYDQHGDRMSYERAGSGLHYSAGWIVRPDGRKEPVRW